MNATAGASASVTDFSRTYESAASSPSNASMWLGSLGESRITVVDAKTYVLEGSASAGSGSATLKWSLRYHQGVDAAREHADALGVVKLDWVSYMPTASVTGHLLVDDGSGRTPQRIELGGSAVGYHDHNSGKWPRTHARTPMPPATAEGARVPTGAIEDADADAASQLKLAFDYKWGSTGDGATVGAVYGAYLLPRPFSFVSAGYVFVRAHGTRLKFSTLCHGHKLRITPMGFVDHPAGHREATAVRLTVETPEWELVWEHAMRSSRANPGGKSLGLVVYEQLSSHNLTLTARQPAVFAADAEGAGGRSAMRNDATPFAQLRGAYGFTEWSNPA